MLKYPSIATNDNRRRQLFIYSYIRFIIQFIQFTYSTQYDPYELIR